MKVGVVGLGAIGSLFFNRVLHHINPKNVARSKADRANQVYALVKDSQVPHLKKVAILDQLRHPILEVPTDVSPNADAFRTDFDQEGRSLDVLLVTVKSTDTYEVAARLKAGSAISKHSLLISLQNGLGNVKILKDVLETDNVLHGVTYMGGVSVSPGTVIQGGDGMTTIQNAEHLSDSVQDTLGRFCQLLAASGIQTQLVPSNDLQSVVWTKLMVNAGINPLGAILNVPNKRVVAGADNLAVVEAIVNEAAAVAKAQGISLILNNATPLEFTVAAAEATGANFCSMCLDIQRHKPTEIGSINDMIVYYGQQAGVPTPHNAFLTSIVKALERSKTNTPMSSSTGQSIS
ncbi:hypothetical protein H310_04329 [Aphanomyces invadans]|uniref:2-dehydropantoate 2-reductase n=1 Tax=Aphanomyces invadans TaxID=157072 RepID=A0A024UCF0_9STRA|nr:hypothetical protein H310_04329 [Aphanomyces invadans]ETW03909.1 hypothetical protein H310_04329 [Aphanomyces invadans]|eukprot:XP_008866865.1 hypothetical protein H310_04329 [Aphanomyces invadans]